MLETLLGGLLGGIFRIIPEVLKWLDRKDERKHELSMQDKAFEFQKLKGDQKVDEIQVQGQVDWNKGAISALRDAISSQATTFQKTGHAFVDFLLACAVFLNVSVRPVITYWFFALYCSAKTAIAIGMIQAGSGYAEAARLSWTTDDMALLAGILNFWFLNRVFEKAKL